jgi:hypothetical protein
MRGNAIAATALLCLTTACLRVEEHLTIRPNGSGTLRIEVQSTARSAGLAQQVRELGSLLAVPGRAAIFPPLSAAHARSLFPDPALSVTATERVDDEGRPGLTVEVAFSDINALLASPYGETHALALTREGDALQFLAHSGFVRAVPVWGSREARGHIPHAMEPAGDVATTFTLTLPSPIASSNGTTAGKSATWRTRCSDATDMAATIRRFGAPFRATCPAAGITFAPASPPRLGLLPFAELRAGPVPPWRVPPDPQRVAAAARVEPAMLKTVRAFRLPGRAVDPEEAGRIRHWIPGPSTTLFAAVVVPRDLAPDRWGTARLREAVDDLGADLRPLGRGFGPFSSVKPPWDMVVEQALRQGSATETRHAVHLSLRPPDPKAARVARLSGTVELEYLVDYRVTKLPHAIPPHWVRGHPAAQRENPPPGATPIASPALDALGIELIALQVSRQVGAPPLGQQKTVFWFRTRSRGSEVAAIQVFDARGEPCPRIPWHNQVTSQAHGEHFAAPGAPEPPFSLALLTTGRPVTAPVHFELADLRLERLAAVPAARRPTPDGEALQAPPARPRRADLPLQEMGFELRVTPLAVKTVEYHLIRVPPDLVQARGRQFLASAGVWVLAELELPEDRYLVAPEEARLTAATDDRGRPVPPGAPQLVFNQDEVPVGGPRRRLPLRLHLALREADARTLHHVRGEATLVVGSGWKTLDIPNAHADPRREVDLARVLPGASLSIQAFGDGQMSIGLRGTGAAEQLQGLQFQLKLPGIEAIPCVPRGRSVQSKDGTYAARLSCAYQLPRNIGGAAARAATLVVRLPDNVRREHGTFTLRSIPLFQPPAAQAEF